MQLHQLLAVVKTKKSKYDSDLTQAYHLIQKDGLFKGISRNYQPKEDNGDMLPSENQLVQQRVDDILDTLKQVVSETWNIVAQHDATNAKAFASIVLPDGTVAAENVPVTFLIWVEKKLENLHEFLVTLPTLDPSDEWTYDAEQRQYRSGITQTQRTTKTQKAIVMFPATDKHPAQTQLVASDDVVGYWRTQKLSGSISQKRRKQLVDRVREIKEAVIKARQEANRTDVVEPRPKVADAMLNYILQ